MAYKTGLDCLKEEMLCRGCTKQQTETKTVAIVLDILANTDTIHTDIYKAREELNHLHAKSEELSRQVSERKEQLRSLYREEHKDLEETRKIIEEIHEYVDKFDKSLIECETPEQRDKMRTVQFFLDNTNINTKYDNTAYIVALGAILSDGRINPISELQKINKKLDSLPTRNTNDKHCLGRW